MRGTAIIILAWNQWPLTARCLQSLRATTLTRARIIVVDNGSRDETLQQLERLEGQVEVVRLTENLGFVRGMNAGIAAASPYDDVVLVNNDIVFTQADWLERLRDAAYAQPQVGIVGCRLHGPESPPRLYHTGGYIEPDELLGQQTESGRVERDVGQYPDTRQVESIAFALVYIRRDCLDAVGVLDERFHSYFEDSDYCLRAAAAGLATVVCGGVTLQHEQHGSTRHVDGFRRRLYEASRVTFAARWRQGLRDAQRAEVLWQGVTRFPERYAQLTRALLRRLEARGLRLTYTALQDEEPDSQDERIDIAMRRQRKPLPDVALVCADGQHFGKAHGRYRVAIGFSEWTRVPQEWADQANMLDCLLVPDAFQVRAFRDAGVRVPIEQLVLGVDSHYCHPELPRHADDDFVFTAVVEDDQADAPGLLIAAFSAAFAPHEAVQLRIHVRPTRGGGGLLAQLQAQCATQGEARVQLISWGFPWYQRGQFLAAADALVSVRRGAGWQPLAAEAIACARPLIATAFGSQEMLARRLGHAVEVARLVEDAAHPGCYWAEPDHDSLVASLRQVMARGRGGLAMQHDRAQARLLIEQMDIDDTATRLDAVLSRAAPGGKPIAAPAASNAALSGQKLSTPAAASQLVVLGMHRSGTSSVAGVLAALGAFAGQPESLLQGPDNPKGHFEHGELHLACVERLQAVDADWMRPPLGAAPVGVSEVFRDRVARLLESFGKRTWLIKEPRLCILVRELLSLLTRPVFIHVIREPAEVVASLQARNGIDPMHALALWEHYSVSAFNATRDQQRVLVDYAQLLEQPLATVRQLHEALEQLGVKGLEPPTAQHVDAWIDPGLRHQRDLPACPLNARQRALQRMHEDGRVLQQAQPLALSARSAAALAALQQP